MIPFETEFVVKIPDPNGFAAQVIAWLRGMKNSRVLDKASDADLDKDHASIRSSNGEALTLRVLRNCNTAEAIGFRHDIPEVERGRFWRTEAVIRWAGQASGEGLLRMRGTCLPLQVGADLDRPKKPYLIKSVLADGLGGNDDVLPVSAAPLLLPETDDGLDLAELALTGRANTYLPVVYISATDVARLSILPNDVSRFAFKLGGVAHVLIEPSRAFSFDLRDRLDGRNPFGGTVAISVPGRGIVRRFWQGPLVPDANALLQMAYEAATELRSTMPTRGWDWTALQDAALRVQRDIERGLLAADQDRQGYETIYEEQIANLKDRIKDLELDLLTARESAAAERDRAAADLPAGLIQEVYEGEMIDRLRAAAQLSLASADSKGLDARSRAVLEAFLTGCPASSAADDLIAEVRRATKDGPKMAAQLERLLSRHGYVAKSDNKHLRLEAAPGFAGLDTLTIPKTPGEYRGLKNQCSDILNAFGLSSRGQ